MSRAPNWPVEAIRLYAPIAYFFAEVRTHHGRNGGLLYVGELPAALAVSAEVPNIGARVSIVTLKGELVGRIGGRFAGEKPGEFVAPHGCVVDSRGDLYVAEVSWTALGRDLKPPREIRSLQKFAKI